LLCYPKEFTAVLGKNFISENIAPVKSPEKYGDSRPVDNKYVVILLFGVVSGTHETIRRKQIYVIIRSDFNDI